MKKHINFEFFYFLKAIIKFKITLDLSFCIELKYVFKENILAKIIKIKIIDIYSIIYKLLKKKTIFFKIYRHERKNANGFPKKQKKVFKVSWLQTIILMRSKYNIWGNGTDFDAWFITSLLS